MTTAPERLKQAPPRPAQAAPADDPKPYRCPVHHMRRLRGGGGKCLDCGYVEPPEWERDNGRWHP